MRNTARLLKDVKTNVNVQHKVKSIYYVTTISRTNQSIWLLVQHMI